MILFARDAFPNLQNQRLIYQSYRDLLLLITGFAIIIPSFCLFKFYTILSRVRLYTVCRVCTGSILPFQQLTSRVLQQLAGFFRFDKYRTGFCFTLYDGVCNSQQGSAFATIFKHVSVLHCMQGFNMVLPYTVCTVCSTSKTSAPQDIC